MEETGAKSGETGQKSREEGSEAASSELAWICPGCSLEMWGGVGCKVRCQKCGYFEDCNAYV